MEFSSALLTISSAVCSLNFLHIWLITLKSKLLMYVLGLCSYTLNRVLMACVRNLGICPCPRCLIKREHIHDLGTAVDRRRRAKLRKCDKVYRSSIESARKIIYELGYVVNSKAVDRILGSESFTPTRVSEADYFQITL